MMSKKFPKYKLPPLAKVPARPITFTFVIAPGKECPEPSLVATMDDAFNVFKFPSLLAQMARGSISAGATSVVGMSVSDETVTAKQILECLAIATSEHCECENIFVIHATLEIDVPEGYRMYSLNRGTLSHAVTFAKKEPHSE